MLTYQGTKELKEQALKYVLDLEADGGTNIYDSMTQGLKLIQEVKKGSGILPVNARQVRVYILKNPSPCFFLFKVV